jgi:hypothetical protein
VEVQEKNVSDRIMNTNDMTTGMRAMVAFKEEMDKPKSTPPDMMVSKRKTKKNGNDASRDLAWWSSHSACL